MPGPALRKQERAREIPRLRRPTHSSRKTVRDAKGAQERMRKKKSACFARSRKAIRDARNANDSGWKVLSCASPSQRRVVASGFCSRFFLICFCIDNLGVGVMARQAAFLGGDLPGFVAVELGLADEFFDAVGETLRGVCVCARVGGSFGSNQKRYFSARGPLFV